MSINEMGPLPLGDRNDIQQQLSLKALRNRLPEEKFLLRDERIDDKGVDVSLEVKVEIRVPRKSGGQEIIHGFTNCRAQGQLKSVSKIEHNNDGSVSYSIEASNLNYLLNGQSPIYFLWLAPKDEIRFAWGKDEWKRLDAENPNWKNQKSFTIRFRNILDAKAVETIHERILKEARFFREINEILGRASHSEGFVLRVDPKALECTDPQKVFEWISKKGMMIVSSGYGSKVLEWFALLNIQDRNDPRVNLVVAYAYVSLGRNYQALANIVEAKIRINKLTLEDREFLNYLEDLCYF